MTTLADILAAGGGALPPVEEFNPKAFALLVPQPTYEAAMAAQDTFKPPGWQHCLQPVSVEGEIHWGIGADILTEALPPYGIMRHVFGHLPNELAATVLVVPWEEFISLLPSSPLGLPT
jgi:hypothetical protein